MKRHGYIKFLFLPLLLGFSLIPVLSQSSKSASTEAVTASSTLRYLPLVVKQPSTPSPETRLVVFEGFYNPT